MGKNRFFLDNYSVTFMDVTYSGAQLNEQFIFGRTFQHNDIAIYKGSNSITVNGSLRLNTNAYIVATENGLCSDWNSFDCIEFRGGTLKKLFFVMH